MKLKPVTKEPHPMQPLGLDKTGVIRFKENTIVRRLLDENGKLTLNDIAQWDVSQEDAEQFAQLIGYSLAGFHELSYVSDASALKATRRAKRLGLFKRRKHTNAGCRTTGCPIHSGIKEKP